MFSFLSHPGLADCRRLFLRNYEVQINIGVHDFEKKGEQRVLINVDLFIPLALSTPQEDNLHEVVDYDFMQCAYPPKSLMSIRTVNRSGWKCSASSKPDCRSQP
jgi:hypothetical protein